jgi:hypothetical protein
MWLVCRSIDHRLGAECINEYANGVGILLIPLLVYPVRESVLVVGMEEEICWGCMGVGLEGVMLGVGAMLGVCLVGVEHLVR